MREEKKEPEMSELAGWAIYAMACLIFGAMALAGRNWP